MIPPPIPNTEASRLKALESYQIIDSLPEAEYDDIIKIAAIICDTPIATISFIDADKQFIKAKVGVEALDVPRSIAFCAHAINQPNEFLIIPDSRNDERFTDNPLVLNKPNIIFYAGIPLVTPDGHALGTLCVMDSKPHDLSETQKSAIKSLANQTISLLELRRKNYLLELSQIKLNVFSTQMEDFAFAASHDLKEPLRMVKSFLALLQKRYAHIIDEKGNTYIHFAVDGANRMEILINDLLEYTRAGRTAHDITETNLNSVIDDIKKLFFLVIEEKEVQIIVSNLPTIQISHSVIMQIFQNLISNAIKYQTPNETSIISISASENETHWQFSVTDNGIGIEPENLQDIFTIFKRLHSKEEYEGTGIGLAICKKLVLEYGGAIWAESVVGKGSTFNFTIKKWLPL